MEIQLKSLTKEQVSEIYKKYLINDFPKMEVKPLKSIISMMEDGFYESLGIYLKGEFVGYAFAMLCPGISSGLVDYLEIVPDKRGQGIGSNVLKELRTYFSDRRMYLESEFPAHAPEPDIATRRLDFYVRNGASDTGVESDVYTVHYINLQISGERVEPWCAMKEIQTIYEYMITNKASRDKYLKFWVKE